MEAWQNHFKGQTFFAEMLKILSVTHIVSQRLKKKKRKSSLFGKIWPITDCSWSDWVADVLVRFYWQASLNYWLLGNPTFTSIHQVYFKAKPFFTLLEPVLVHFRCLFVATFTADFCVLKAMSLFTFLDRKWVYPIWLIKITLSERQKMNDRHPSPATLLEVYE